MFRAATRLKNYPIKCCTMGDSRVLYSHRAKHLPNQALWIRVKIMTKTLNERVTVSEIARAIAKDWETINTYAAEYLNAMLTIESVEDTYYADSAKSVILYFLSNAGSYRGDNARSYKALLKAMVK